MTPPTPSAGPEPHTHPGSTIVHTTITIHQVTTPIIECSDHIYSPPPDTNLPILLPATTATPLLVSLRHCHVATAFDNHINLCNLSDQILPLLQMDTHLPSRMHLPTRNCEIVRDKQRHLHLRLQRKHLPLPFLSQVAVNHAREDPDRSARSLQCDNTSSLTTRGTPSCRLTACTLRRPLATAQSSQRVQPT